MVVTFQLLNAPAAVTPSAEVYGVEPINGLVDTAPLAAAAAPILSEPTAKAQVKALVWDDLIFKRVKYNWIPFQVQWPPCDRLLTPQVSHRGRCAIRADVLHELHQAQQIPVSSDTSAALAYLAVHEPEAIAAIPGIFRFAGFGYSPFYRPVTQPKPAQTASSISVVINYRDRPDLMTTCLESIAEQTITAQLEVLLVDNQSKPENRQRVEAVAKDCFSEAVRVVHLSYDAPFNHSAQTNLAVEAATGDVLFMLNNDADLVSPELVQTLSDWALTAGVASAGPRVVGAGDHLVSSGVEVFPAEGKRATGIRESTVAPLSQTVRRAAGNSFACAAIAREVWFKVGGLDPEAFPTQYNDADFDLKALALGLDHLYIGHLKAYHQPGQSEPRTRQQGEMLHNKIREKHAPLQAYESISPVLIKWRGPVLAHLVNPTKTARALMTYRKLHKRIRTQVLKRDRKA